MKIKMIDIQFFLYGICIFCYDLTQCQINNTDIIKGIMFLVLVIWSLLKICQSEKFKISLLFRAALVIGFIIWEYRVSQGENELFLIVLVMLLAYDMDVHKMLKVYSTGTFFVLLFSFIMSSIGLFPNKIDSVGRYYLGFRYPTFAANLFFSAVVAYIAFRGKKINIYEALLFSIINIFLFLKTNTLAVFILVFCILIMVYLLKKKSDYNTVGKFIISNIPIILTIVTLAVQIYYNYNYHNDSCVMLNKALSGRLYLGRKAFAEYPITLFGQKIEWIFSGMKGEYFYVDSSYLNILFGYGVITLSAICLIFRKILKYFVNNSEYFICMSIVIFLIHSVTDPQLLTFRYDPFITMYLAVVIKQMNMSGKKNNKREKINEI